MKFSGRQNKKNTHSKCFIYSQFKNPKLKYFQLENTNCVITNNETQFYAKGNKDESRKTMKSVHSVKYTIWQNKDSK